MAAVNLTPLRICAADRGGNGDLAIWKRREQRIREEERVKCEEEAIHSQPGTQQAHCLTLSWCRK
jgi:hypothetical protein